MEPVHYMGMDMAAIDVKDLLKSAPIRAPTRQELTSSVIASSQVRCLVLYVCWWRFNYDWGKRPRSDGRKEG